MILLHGLKRMIGPGRVVEPVRDLHTWSAIHFRREWWKDLRLYFVPQLLLRRMFSRTDISYVAHERTQ
jgi:hypothetical protein